mmetsp:Transcript_13935/g.24395  ORF Transcript_13935/g.24395 Transcript_13935/m.24395 type:complete len:221 (-) Transcript_13935:1348-2010(-)
MLNTPISAAGMAYVGHDEPCKADEEEPKANQDSKVGGDRGACTSILDAKVLDWAPWSLHQWVGSVQLALFPEVVDHHCTPCIADEASPRVPLPTRWYLIVSEESACEEHTCNVVDWEECIGLIHVSCNGSAAVRQCDASLPHEVENEPMPEEVALQVDEEDGQTAEDETAKHLRYCLLDQLVEDIREGAVTAISCLTVEQRPLLNYRWHVPCCREGGQCC